MSKFEVKRIIIDQNMNKWASKFADPRERNDLGEDIHAYVNHGLCEFVQT